MGVFFSFNFHSSCILVSISFSMDFPLKVLQHSLRLDKRFNAFGILVANLVHMSPNGIAANEIPRLRRRLQLQQERIKLERALAHPLGQ
jgi:hypothetical protein